MVAGARRRHDRRPPGAAHRDGDSVHRAARRGGAACSRGGRAPTPELRAAAELQTAEFERLIETRTRELSDLSTHLQEFAEKEKSELAKRLHDELGGLLTAAKMDLSWLQSRLADAPYSDRLSQLGGVLDEAMNLKRRVGGRTASFAARPLRVADGAAGSR